ncbi:MFS general substrate transporter [Xylariomycetidae sp. FL2044]|nr:MFS general substrate transporter [Xylariomycetidae sp. FL2044]
MSQPKYEVYKDDEDNETLHDVAIDSYKNSIGHVDDAELGLGLLRDESGQDATLIASRARTPQIATIATRSTTSTSSRASPQPSKTESKQVVGWRDLPRKEQLVVITLARLAEPLVQTSLQAYMFYQLRWFDPSLPDSVISSQAGILQASFTAAQFFTAMIWGRVADSSWAGRKTVILIGLFGTLISCLGFGFSTTFYQALFWRSLGGATNGNVGVLRTMISEIVREKKYQSRAFLLLPMTFNIGTIIGPVLGGVLSDPAGSYPDSFGNVGFFLKFPYATPNIVSALILMIAFLLCWLLLEETHDSLRDKRDMGILVGRKIIRVFRKRRNKVAYTPLHTRESSVSTIVEMSPLTPRQSHDSPRLSSKRKHTTYRRYTTTLPFRRIFTPNVTLTLIAHFCFAFHIGTFTSLWFVFLSTPAYNPSKPELPGFHPEPPFRFTGGLGLPPQSVGLAMALLGFIGISLQLFLYPRLSTRFGTLLSWRVSLFAFPVAYTLCPFLSIVPSTTAPPSQKTGAAIWLAIAGVLFVQVTGRTFAMPAQTILVNNCTPHPSVLGTVHGLGQSVSSLARTVGPILCGWLYGLGLSHGLVGGVFWGLAGVAMCNILVSYWVFEGDGHEIWLEGDEGDDEHGARG